MKSKHTTTFASVKFPELAAHYTIKYLLGLSEDHTTEALTLTSTTTDSGTHDDVSLLGLVTKTMGLIGTRRAVARKDVGALAVFPSADTSQESERVRLLVAAELFHILIRTHVCVFVFSGRWQEWSTMKT